jgi:hypothetical protein
MVVRFALLVSCLLVMMAFVTNPEAGARGHCVAGKVVTRAFASAVGSTSVLAVRPIHIAFKGDHRITDRAFVLLATPPLAVRSSRRITVEVEGDLQEEGGDDTFPAEGISANAKTTALGNVELDICADRVRPEHVQPGRHTGAITLRGADFASTTLAIDVTVQGSQLRAMLLIAAGLMLGVVLKLFPVLFPNSPGEGEKREDLDGRRRVKSLLMGATRTWRA